MCPFSTSVVVGALSTPMACSRISSVRVKETVDNENLLSLEREG